MEYIKLVITFIGAIVVSRFVTIKALSVGLPDSDARLFGFIIAIIFFLLVYMFSEE